MTEQKFRSEMRRAKTMQEISDNPMMSEYWAGYMRGLRRSYHGENFGTAEEHDLWLSLIGRDDEQSKQRGQGYRDGLAFGEISSRMGRPSVGDAMLDKITVPSELKAALEARAGELGVPVVEIRREAYRKFVE